jgi:hypothetical protein
MQPAAEYQQRVNDLLGAKERAVETGNKRPFISITGSLFAFSDTVPCLDCPRSRIGFRLLVLNSSLFE